MNIKIKPYKTPWLDASAHKTHAAEKEAIGIYAEIASSPLMAVLYSARAAKPDQIVATLRLARQVHRWTKFDDRRLLRLLGYIRESANEKLRGALSTEDEGSVVLRFWRDADLAGDPETDRSMGLAWNGRKQTFTADSTAYAEIGSMHEGLKEDVIPLAGLLEFLLERPIVIETCEDNTAVLKAVQEGYSPKLRHLSRHNRINLSWLGEFFSETGNVCRYAVSDTHKGDLFTKEFNADRLAACKKLIGLGTPAFVSQHIMSGGILRTVPEHLALISIKASHSILQPGIDS